MLLGLSYVAFGAPVVVAGRPTDSLGIVPTLFWCGSASVILAVLSLGAQFRSARLDSTRSQASIPA
jgi:hypothetical protein